jgi:hypothetical protein
MAKLLDRLSKEMNKMGLTQRTPKSRTWLKNQVKNLSNPRQALIRNKENHKVKSVTGRMYFYYYDPKTKETLPYYDRFPLVIPIERYGDGFLGLNLHYLPPNLRLVLLDKLYDLLNNDNFDEKTRFRMSYSLLSGAARYKEFKPCVKRYLFSHLRSNFIEIPADQWEIAIFLPTEQFVGATSKKVHKESREKI